MQEIKLRQTTITQGRYMGEEGVSLSLMLPDEKIGNLNGDTRGYYQGNQVAIDAVLEDGYKIAENKLGTASIYNANDVFVTDDAEQAIEMGIIRRVAA